MSEQIENSSVAEEEAWGGQAPALPSVGSQLRQAREGRGLAVSDIAQALKLGPRQVEALERDDWADLPGTTFIRGFVRNYARLVGLDPQPLMAHLGGLLEKPLDTLNVPAAAPAEIRSGGRTRDRAVVSIGVGLVVLALLAYFLLPNNLVAWRASLQTFLDGDTTTQESAEVPVPSATAQEPLFPPEGSVAAANEVPIPVAPSAVVSAEAPVVAPVAASVAAVQPPRLRFQVARESWVEVRDADDVVVFSQRMMPGSEQQVGGKSPLSVTIGYAPGVSLYVQGKLLDLTPYVRGDVARLQVE